MPLDDEFQFSISSIAVLVACVQREVFLVQTAVRIADGVIVYVRYSQGRGAMAWVFVAFFF